MLNPVQAAIEPQMSLLDNGDLDVAVADGQADGIALLLQLRAGGPVHRRQDRFQRPQMQTRPLGVQSVANPLQATGGCDAESAEDIRIVIEPRARTVDPVLLMESLYKLSELESRIPLNMNVLVNGLVPRVLSLGEALQQWLDHRREVLVRRSRYRLAAVERRMEILAEARAGMTVFAPAATKPPGMPCTSSVGRAQVRYRTEYPGSPVSTFEPTSVCR